MPLVRAILQPHAPVWVEDLYEACREIVPAAFNTPQGPLTPGSIEFDRSTAERRVFLTVDVFLEVEAFPYEDRDPQQVAEDIHGALKQLFPGVTFAVWPKLVNAGWAADSTDPEFDGDMSMEAAIERARGKLDKLRHPSLGVRGN